MMPDEGKQPVEATNADILWCQQRPRNPEESPHAVKQKWLPKAGNDHCSALNVYQDHVMVEEKWQEEVENDEEQWPEAQQWPENNNSKSTKRERSQWADEQEQEDCPQEQCEAWLTAEGEKWLQCNDVEDTSETDEQWTPTGTSSKHSGWEGSSSGEPSMCSQPHWKWQTVWKQHDWKSMQPQQDDCWMTPFDDLIAGTCFASPTSGAVCIASCSHSQDGQELFTDGQQFYQPIESDDGQHLYTDGRQLYAPVCVVVAGTQEEEVMSFAPEKDIGEPRFDPYDPLGLVLSSLMEDEASIWATCWG